MTEAAKNKVYHSDTETQGNLEGLNRISGIILQCSIEVHKQLGPGLLKSVYEVCLVKELIAKGNFKPIITWLNEKIHSQGCLFKSTELIQNATGAKLDSNIFKQYLSNKYLA